jgi:hypothetical protein
MEAKKQQNKINEKKNLTLRAFYFVVFFFQKKLVSDFLRTKQVFIFDRKNIFRFRKKKKKKSVSLRKKN